MPLSNPCLLCNNCLFAKKGSKRLSCKHVMNASVSNALTRNHGRIEIDDDMDSGISGKAV